MRYRFWIVLLFAFSKFNGFSQEKYVKHAVAKGETISKIAEHYKIKASSIYELNPDAQKGIQYKQVLLIPVVSVKNEKNTPLTSEVASILTEKHVVLAKETLYGISKQYGVKVADLYAMNPSLEKRGLRVGNEIVVPVVDAKQEVVLEEKLPSKETTQTAVKVEIQPEITPVIAEKSDAIPLEQLSANGNLIREVLAKETLYGIARQYGVSVADIEKANPILANQALRIGQKIVIPTAKAAENQENSKEDKKEEVVVANTAVAEQPKEVALVKADEANTEVEITHEVLAKETKYGIAKEFGITVKELEEQNPKIVNRLLIGEKLTIRTSKSNVKTTPKFDFSDALTKTEPEYNVKSFHGADFIDQLICTASENIGVRYRSGGTSKDGFDCSGLMFSTFGAYDIQLPRSSFEQAQYGVKVNNEDAKKGDLIFFKTNGRRQINHVGMVVEVGEDGEIKFIHASTSSGVIISSLKEEYYSKRVTQINRVL